MLRFNVSDIETAARALRDQGVAVEVMAFDWDRIGAFADPDGNACKLVDAGDREFSA